VGFGVEDQERLAVDVEILDHAGGEAVAPVDGFLQVVFGQPFEHGVQLAVQRVVPRGQARHAGGDRRVVVPVQVILLEVLEPIDIGLLELAHLLAERAECDVVAGQLVGQILVDQDGEQVAPQLLGGAEQLAMLLHEGVHCFASLFGIYGLHDVTANRPAHREAAGDVEARQ